jgi:hypothetical protein
MPPATAAPMIDQGMPTKLPVRAASEICKVFGRITTRIPETIAVHHRVHHQKVRISQR